MVARRVFRSTGQNQVLDSVIHRVAVLVVHLLAGKQCPAKLLTHNMAVSGDPSRLAWADFEHRVRTLHPALPLNPNRAKRFLGTGSDSGDNLAKALRRVPMALLEWWHGIILRVHYTSSQRKRKV